MVIVSFFLSNCLAFLSSLDLRFTLLIASEFPKAFIIRNSILFNKSPSVPFFQVTHWLPVQQRIDFKILVHVYNSVYGTSPMYLQELFNKYNSGRNSDQPMITHDLQYRQPKDLSGTSLFLFQGPDFGTVSL